LTGKLRGEKGVLSRGEPEKKEGLLVMREERKEHNPNIKKVLVDLLAYSNGGKGDP